MSDIAPTEDPTSVPAEAAHLGPVTDPANWTVGHDVQVAEIIEGATGRVWICQAPMTRDEYDALPAGVPDGYAPLGIGRSVADVAYFRRSPGAAEDGPVETQAVGDHTFSFIAIGGDRQSSPRGIMVLPVDKHHSMWFRAGRTIEILDIGDGAAHIPQTAEVEGDGWGGRGTRTVPDGWTIREVTLDEPLTVHVDNPAMTYWFGDGSSFQGPVDLDL